MGSMDQVSVIIPAYRPDQKLIGTLEGLCREGFTDILVVDELAFFLQIGRASCRERV